MKIYQNIDQLIGKTPILEINNFSSTGNAVYTFVYALLHICMFMAVG